MRIQLVAWIRILIQEVYKELNRRRETQLKDRKLSIKSIKINVIGIKMFIMTLFSLKFNIIFGLRRNFCF
jgi:hypothetical protein